MVPGADYIRRSRLLEGVPFLLCDILGPFSFQLIYRGLLGRGWRHLLFLALGCGIYTILIHLVGLPIY